MTRKILFTLRKPPYGSSLGREAVDAILAASAYDQDLSVLFLDDGVFQLLKTQNPVQGSAKNLASVISAFPLYDISQLYVDKDSLIERNINESDLVVPVTVVDKKLLKKLIQQQETILSF